jgi:hypothetical protein
MVGETPRERDRWQALACMRRHRAAAVTGSRAAAPQTRVAALSEQAHPVRPITSERFDCTVCLRKRRFVPWRLARTAAAFFAGLTPGVAPVVPI